MTVTGELIHLPVLSPAPGGLTRRRSHAVAQYNPQGTWRHRIYRIPSQNPGEDFTYGADGHKRLKPSQGRHVDLYA